jgi:hypothetical protein
MQFLRLGQTLKMETLYQDAYISTPTTALPATLKAFAIADTNPAHAGAQRH